MNLSNFESRAYWFNALSKVKFQKQLLGGIPPEEKVEIVLPLTTVDGDKIFASGGRKKRANTPIGPECNNLPAFKNWVAEGKTAPVQDQGECGSFSLKCILSLFTTTLLKILFYLDRKLLLVCGNCGS